MSVARGFGLNGKSLYTNVTKPCEVNCNFIVDSTNGNGLGQRSLKSNGYIEQVYLTTSASFSGTINSTVNVTGIASGTSSLKVGMPLSGTNIPAGTLIASIVSSSAITMTNAATGSATETIAYAGVGAPITTGLAAGYALIRFRNNFNYYLGGFSGFIAPPASTGVTSLTAGNVYTIFALGTTTLAQWQAAGLPQGFVPTVGQSFVATATASLGGTGTVSTPGASQISAVSVVGDPNQTLNNSSIASNNGAIILVQFLAATSSSVPTLVATAPSNNSAVSMLFSFDGSSVTIDGL